MKGSLFSKLGRGCFFAARDSLEGDKGLGTIEAPDKRLVAALINTG
jgi:hypothetical protein